MMLPSLFESVGTVKLIFGLLPERTERDCASVAARGGFGSTVGMTSWGAFRWESVMEPSEFGHIITMGEFAICWPKPLRNAKSCENMLTAEGNGARTWPSSPDLQLRDSEAYLRCMVSMQTAPGNKEYIHWVLEPLCTPPMHIKSVHTTSPFRPISAVALPDDVDDVEFPLERLDADGLAAVDVAAEVEEVSSYHEFSTN